MSQFSEDSYTDTPEQDLPNAPPDDLQALRESSVEDEKEEAERAGRTMTPLSESRLRGLAEALAKSGPVDPNLRGEKWFFGYYPIGWQPKEWLQETWDGAGFILEWMQDNDPKANHYFAVTIESAVGAWYVGFINNVDHREGEATEVKLTHAIAQAAADALEVPE